MRPLQYGYTKCYRCNGNNTKKVNSKGHHLTTVSINQMILIMWYLKPCCQHGELVCSLSQFPCSFFEKNSFHVLNLILLCLEESFFVIHIGNYLISECSWFLIFLCSLSEVWSLWLKWCCRQWWQNQRGKLKFFCRLFWTLKSFIFTCWTCFMLWMHQNTNDFI